MIQTIEQNYTPALCDCKTKTIQTIGIVTGCQESFALFKRDFLPKHPDIIYHRISRPEDVIGLKLTSIIQDQIFTEPNGKEIELLEMAKQRIINN